MIDRRSFVRNGTLAAAITMGGALPSLAQTRTDWFDRAVVIDGLAGLSNPGGAENETRLTDAAWRDYRETGVTAMRVTVMPVGNVPDAWQAYRESLDSHDAVFASNPARLVKVLKAQDILDAKRKELVGVVLGTQDTYMVGPELDRLAKMREDGVRTVQLTYNNRNLSGDGAIEPDNAGLSKLGRATIERIEAEKLLLDLSHGGARTMAEAAAHATRPLVVSHTGARAMSAHPRHTSDETMRAVADKGGVIGLYFMPYLDPDGFDDASGEVLLAHADHMLNTVGEDHIGIGTDNGPLPMPDTPEMRAALDEWQQERIDAGIAAPGEKVGWYPWVADYNTIDRYERFAQDLVRRGWTIRQVEKMLGTNFLRVYRDSFG